MGWIHCFVPNIQAGVRDLVSLETNYVICKKARIIHRKVQGKSSNSLPGFRGFPWSTACFLPRLISHCRHQPYIDSMRSPLQLFSCCSQHVMQTSTAQDMKPLLPKDHLKYYLSVLSLYKIINHYRKKAETFFFFCLCTGSRTVLWINMYWVLSMYFEMMCNIRWHVDLETQVW